MRHRLTTLLLTVGALVPFAAPAARAAARAGEIPSSHVLYQDGPDDRFLLNGPWLRRLDPSEIGLKRHWQSSASRSGWTTVTVPNAWNVGDDSVASMGGGIGWYRKDFRLPDKKAGLSWIARFESVNYRVTAWLNGHRLGSHTGAYLPFELDLHAVRRTGLNRLVVRVDSRRKPTDFPPATFRDDGTPLGGWWNYSGILREVYIRRIDRVALQQVVIRPQLACRACATTVLERALLRNLTGHAQTVKVSGRFGTKAKALGTAIVPPHGTATVQGTFRIAHPKLWSPDHPNLYPARVAATIGKRRISAYDWKSGVRKIAVKDGMLQLNDRPLHLRGVGLHEDSADNGFALTQAQRNDLVAQTRDLGAKLIRAHYPLHPHIQELADRDGILLWSEVPVYSLRTQYLAEPQVRRLAAQELAANITANENHPAIMMWSIANELSSKPGPVQGAYIASAVRQAKRLDPTRPVGLAFAGYPSAGCQPRYAPLDVLGMNTYFGWYTGGAAEIADRERIGPFLDEMRACYPKQALIVSEFGVEANRSGPVEEKGTYQFQNQWTEDMLDAFDARPWLSGAVYWALKEFRVRPFWNGGNPRPDPPWHEKGLITRDGIKKPIWSVVQRRYGAIKQTG